MMAVINIVKVLTTVIVMTSIVNGLPVSETDPAQALIINGTSSSVANMAEAFVYCKVDTQDIYNLHKYQVVILM